MNKLLFIFLSVGLLSINKIYSQGSNLEKVGSFDFKNIKAIEEKGQVKGYFFFYTIDKVNRDESLYGLCVYDNNFKQTHYKEVVKSNKIKLVDGKFNGSHFCFQFFDAKEKQYEFVVYNMELNETGKFFIAIPKDYVETMTSPGMGANFQTQTMISLPETGFAALSTLKFELTAYNEKGTELWKANSGNTDSKLYEVGSIMSVSSDMIVSNFIFYKDRRKMVDGENNLIIFDTKTGKQISKTPITGLNNYISFSDLSNSQDGYILSGEYYNKETKKTGPAIIHVLKDGKVKSQTYFSLKEDASKVVKDQKQLDLLDDKALLIDKILQLNNGKVFLIGELYDKRNIYDMVIFEFQDDKLANIHFLNKQKTNIANYFFAVNGTQAVGMMLKMGMFNTSDYCYTALNADKSGFTTVYCNYEKESESGDFIIGSATVTKDNKLVTDQVKLNSKPSNFTVLPAKPGYVAVFEYFKKEKKVNMKLEKLNL